MTHYDTEIIAYNSVIIVTRFADVERPGASGPVYAPTDCRSAPFPSPPTLADTGAAGHPPGRAAVNAQAGPGQSHTGTFSSESRSTRRLA